MLRNLADGSLFCMLCSLEFSRCWLMTRVPVLTTFLPAVGAVFPNTKVDSNVSMSTSNSSCRRVNYSSYLIRTTNKV